MTCRLCAFSKNDGNAPADNGSDFFSGTTHPAVLKTESPILAALFRPGPGYLGDQSSFMDVFTSTQRGQTQYYGSQKEKTGDRHYHQIVKSGKSWRFKEAHDAPPKLAKQVYTDLYVESFAAFGGFDDAPEQPTALDKQFYEELQFNIDCVSSQLGGFDRRGAKTRSTYFGIVRLVMLRLFKLGIDWERLQNSVFDEFIVEMINTNCLVMIDDPMFALFYVLQTGMPLTHARRILHLGFRTRTSNPDQWSAVHTAAKWLGISSGFKSGTTVAFSKATGMGLLNGLTSQSDLLFPAISKIYKEKAIIEAHNYLWFMDACQLGGLITPMLEVSTCLDQHFLEFGFTPAGNEMGRHRIIVPYPIKIRQNWLKKARKPLTVGEWNNLLFCLSPSQQYGGLWQMMFGSGKNFSVNVRPFLRSLANALDGTFPGESILTAVPSIVKILTDLHFHKEELTERLQELDSAETILMNSFSDVLAARGFVPVQTVSFASELSWACAERVLKMEHPFKVPSNPYSKFRLDTQRLTKNIEFSRISLYQFQKGLAMGCLMKSLDELNGAQRVSPKGSKNNEVSLQSLMLHREFPSLLL